MRTPSPSYGRLDLAPPLADQFIFGVAPSITARYFSSCPSDSTSRWTPCPPECCGAVAAGPPWLLSDFRLRARLGFSIPSPLSGQRGITPAFGYGAPHSSARGTSTLLSNALLSARRVGGGAPARWPPSAAQTVRAVFPHTAFTKTHASEMQTKESIESGTPCQ